MEGIINLFFPRRCPVCDDIVKVSEGLICRGCAPKIKYVTGPACMKCGKMLSSEDLEYCHDCRTGHHIYDRGMALYDYKSIADSIYRFKYKGRREYADFYGEEISRCLGNEIKRMRPDALIPVPVHSKKLRERGYNQATALAKVLSAHLQIPVEDKLVIRQKNTAPQKELNVRERQNNLKKAFKIAPNDVKLNTIVIIDDIYTTGSTIDAMAEELKKTGVDKIYFTALAIGRGI